ncbi:MAG: hypothetical protein AB1894_23990 [Chloroflexota bacterium]
MELQAVLAHMQQSWQILQQRWEAVGALWDDPVRRGFEGQYWQPLDTQADQTRQALERLAQVVSQARRSVK